MKRVKVALITVLLTVDDGYPPIGLEETIHNVEETLNAQWAKFRYGKFETVMAEKLDR